MKNSTPNWLLPIFFILWLFFVLGSFFAVQKPFTAANAEAISRIILNLFAAGWLMLIGLGLGLWVLELLAPARLSFGERLVLGPALGLGILGLLVFGLGLLGLFQPFVAYAVTIGLTILALPPLRRMLQTRDQFQFIPPNRWVSAYLLVIGVFTLALALLPPTDWDGLFYHLTAPKLYLETGGIVSGFDVPHFSFPSLMEMLFAWAMLLNSDIAAKLLHTGFGLLLVGLVYVTAQRWLGQKSVWPAVVILTSMPMLSTLAGWAYNDLALAFYQLASLYSIINYQLVMNNRESSISSSDPEIVNRESETCAERSRSIRNRSWLVLSAVFSGLAMGLKYTSFVTPVTVGLLILWFAYRPSRSTPGAFRSNGLVDFFVFSAIALLVASPWYLRNWAFTGNPVYPFLYGLFGGEFWDSFRADWYAAGGTGIIEQPVRLLLLPWLLTLGIFDANYWDGRTGPLLLLFLPLVVWVGVSRRFKNKPAAIQPLLIFALAHFGFWTLGVIWSKALWQSRLLLPGLVALAPVAGWLWTNLSRFDLPQFSLSRVVNLAIGLTLALTVIDIGLLTLQIDPIPHLTGLESRNEYLTRRLGAHYAAMQQLDQALPAEAKVVFLWEPRSYYCQANCQPDSILDEFPHLVYRHQSAEAIAQAWREAEITHILVHRTGLEFVLNESPEAIDVEVLETLEEQYWQKVFDVAGAYQVYALQEPASIPDAATR